jgi:hypothetical protein
MLSRIKVPFTKEKSPKFIATGQVITFPLLKNACEVANRIGLSGKKIDTMELVEPDGKRKEYSIRFISEKNS